MTASCEQEQLQQAIAASLVQQPASVSLLDASELPMARPPVTRPLVARPLRGSGKSRTRLWNSAAMTTYRDSSCDRIRV